MTLMIALIGEQPLPNFLLARHQHPDALLLVYTLKTDPVYEKLKATLQPGAAIYELLTDPFDIITIIKDLKDKLAEPELAAHQSFVFNLTGGTKAMSLAAYHVAQQRNTSIVYMESEGKHNQVFRYEWKEQQLQEPTDNILPECIELKDFFNMHLGLMKWHVDGPSATEGGLLERAVGEVLRSHGYEVMMGVKIMKEQVDIDVAVRSGNQFGIIEAKVGDEGRGLNGIKQLSTAKRHLGTFTQQFYVINVTPTPSQKEIVDAANIKVISLLDYRRGATSLSSSDTKELIKQIDEALKE
jgi:Domain of unknown function (DUF1887)